jgi:hypothetical protein
MSSNSCVVDARVNLKFPFGNLGQRANNNGALFDLGLNTNRAFHTIAPFKANRSMANRSGLPHSIALGVVTFQIDHSFRNG